MSTLPHIIVRAADELWAVPGAFAHSTHYVESMVRIPFTPQRSWAGMGLIEGQAHVVILLKDYVSPSSSKSAARPLPKNSWLILLEPMLWRTCLGVDHIVGYAEDLVVMKEDTQNAKAKRKSHWKGSPVWVLDMECLLSAFNLQVPNQVAQASHGT